MPRVSYFSYSFSRLALDPMGYFITKPVGTEEATSRRLHATDFKITKAIYTDIHGLGSSSELGSVNIYANGGHNQPNCDCEIPSMVLEIYPGISVNNFPCGLVFHFVLFLFILSIIIDSFPFSDTMLHAHSQSKVLRPINAEIIPSSAQTEPYVTI